MMKIGIGVVAAALALAGPACAQADAPAWHAPIGPQPVAGTSLPADDRSTESAAVRIFIASDSTAQPYGPDRFPQSGWGQFLSCHLVPGVIIQNRAIGGRSTRTFIAEGRWDRIMADLRAGDVILIQFGHNDATRSKPERYADPTTTFRDNLLRMVWEARGRGAMPVLITPVARRAFGKDGTVNADFAAWSAVTREVAATTSSALIDLEAESRAMLQALGPDAARRLYLHYPAQAYPAFPDGIADDTHFSEAGARRIAGLIGQRLIELPPPAGPLARPPAADDEACN